jgi:hypothetical protein
VRRPTAELHLPDDGMLAVLSLESLSPIVQEALCGFGVYGEVLGKCEGCEQRVAISGDRGQGSAQSQP